MKKTLISISSMLMLFGASSVFAATVNWLPGSFDNSTEYNQFTYSIQSNGGDFFGPTFILKASNATGTNAIDNFTSGNYATGISTSPNESPLAGKLDLQAGAKGSGSATSPANGLTVQAYAEMRMNGLNGATEGAKVNQQILSSVTRNFKVSENGNFTLSATFLGDVNFTDFTKTQQFSPVPGFTMDVTASASHNLVAEARLQKFSIIGGTITALDTGNEIKLNLSPTDRNLATSVALISKTPGGDDIFYQLAVRLNLKGELNTFDFASGQTSSVPANAVFDLGTETNPLMLSASVTSSAPVATPVPGSVVMLLSGLGGLLTYRRRNS